MIDATTPNTPGWWLARLAQRLQQRIVRYDQLENYYIGRHPLPIGDRTRARLYRELQRRARSNYTGLVVESVKERLHVDGFRAGGSASDTQDDAAWEVWQANSLDADSGLVHQNALTFGVAYVIVGTDPEKPDSSGPLITVEDPRQVIHESYPTNRRRVRAALKLWLDEVTRQRQAVVYLEDQVCYFKAPPPGTNVGASQLWAGPGDAARWQWDAVAYGAQDEALGATVKNTSGVVPVVPFYNRPRTRPEGIETLGEFEDVIDVQDRINGVVLDRLVISRMQAYRQRYMTGVEPQKDDAGNAKRPFDPDVTSMWVAVDPAAKFGDFSETDITPILNATSGDVTHLAAITRTPPQYLLGQMANLSGDALEAAQAGLVSKVRERQRHYGESWEQVIRLAGMVGDNSGVSPDAEVIWADPTQRSLTDLAAAAVQQLTAGVPWRSRMIQMGYTPADIERMETEQAQDSLRAQMQTPVPTMVRLTENEALGMANNQPGPGPADDRVSAAAATLATSQNAPGGPTPPPPPGG